MLSMSHNPKSILNCSSQELHKIDLCIHKRSKNIPTSEIWKLCKATSALISTVSLGKYGAIQPLHNIVLSQNISEGAIMP